MTMSGPFATVEVLSDIHDRLDLHFRELHDRRQLLDGEAPVFALEHGLDLTDLERLKYGVRLAVTQGFIHRLLRSSWLPFVVYSAELGYDYVGNEFWPSFELATPDWQVYGDRDRIRMWFRRFNTEYGGAVPKGAFARNFPIIAWPITHAVLPVYLQRHLAQLLYEFRMGLTADLLRQPEELGAQLAARAWDYTERFRIFCENTSLLGQVAVALLSGEGEQSQYLLPTTLLRVIDGLEQESQAKYWLHGARIAASRVRAQGLQKDSPRAAISSVKNRMPNPTDARLVLRASDRGWTAYAELPDLSPLSRRLPHIYEDLRAKRAHVEGAHHTILAGGRLTNSGLEVRLTHWPDPMQPFLQLEGGDTAVNNLLRDQVEITRGPIWVFKCRSRGSAVEVKGKLIHPGGTYYVVHKGGWIAPKASWVQPVEFDVTGAEAVRLVIPSQLEEFESDSLVQSGLTVGSGVFVRPVGITASMWDGAGAVEWLRGEPGLIGISVEQIPDCYTLQVAGKLRTQKWPEGEREIFLQLGDIPVGTHELRVALNDSKNETLAEGLLLVTTRDPQVRDGSAGAGEGIRLLPSPARPTMSDLWEPGAITIVGPAGLRVELLTVLRSEDNREIARLQQQVLLPVLAPDWIGIAKKIRGDDKFIRGFDQAESVELVVSRAGIGYATLGADRGFQPLRWQLLRGRDRNRARLIDRTDSGSTTVELYCVESPLVAVRCELGTDIVAPATGGLLKATAGGDIDASAMVLLPTQPNDLLGRRIRPEIITGARTPAEVIRLASAYRQWALADLPSDAFAQHQRDEVLESISRATVSLIAPGRWATIERRIANAVDPLDLMEDMQRSIGDTEDQKRLAHKIGMNLHAWLDPMAILAGFAEATQSTLRASGFSGHDSAARFLLSLAGRTGQTMQWADPERQYLLQQAMNTPLLVRAARFAVLGTRFLNEAHTAGRGF